MRRSSTIWVVSGLVSLAAHAGILSALAQISIEPAEGEVLADVVLAGGTLASLAEVAAADAASEAVAAEVTAAVAPADASDGGALASDSGSLAAEPASNPLPGSAPGASAPEEAAASASTSTTSEAAPAEAQAALPVSPVTSAVQPAESGPVAPTPAGATAAATAPDVAVAPTQSPAAAPAPGAGAPITEGPAAPAATAALAPAASASEAAPAAAAVASEAPGTQAVPSASPSQPAAAPPLPAGTQVAAITSALPQVISQAEKIDRFLSSYRGSGCLYALPKSLDGARPSFAGFGGERVVADFATAFRNAVGVEPELAIRTVKDAQCAAVDFLKALGEARLTTMELVLDAEAVANGGVITGHIKGNPLGAVRLLVIGDDGAVSDISKDFVRTAGRNFFMSPVVADTEGRDRNQIIVALASRTPLTIEATHRPGEAQVMFGDIARQVLEQDARVMIGYGAFRVK